MNIPALLTLRAANLLTVRAVDLARRRPDAAFPLFLSFVLAFAFSLQWSGISIGRWGMDEAEHLTTVESGGATANSAADIVVGVVTPFLQIGPFYNGVTTIALCYIIARITYTVSLRGKCVIFLLVFPLFFQLQFISKESIVTIYVALIYGITRSIPRRNLRYALYFSLLLSMAMIFRSYYYISLAFAGSILLFCNQRLLISVLLGGLFFASLIEPIRGPLIAARLYVYQGVSDAAASKIPLLFSGFTWYDFIGGYFTSAFFFIFPIILNIRIQELYMQLYSLCLILTFIEAIRRGDRGLVSLFGGIALTLPVFVAEVGTFSRHISAVVPVLLMSLHFSRMPEPALRKRLSCRPPLADHGSILPNAVGSSLEPIRHAGRRQGGDAVTTAPHHQVGDDEQTRSAFGKIELGSR